MNQLELFIHPPDFVWLRRFGCAHPIGRMTGGGLDVTLGWAFDGVPSRQSVELAVGVV